MKVKRSLFLLLAVATFLFRLAAGLTSSFRNEDNKQIYLIGLKYYTTHVYPYYGPDVVYTETQIPGGLQGLLVGLPFFVLPAPEAPFLFLAIISFAALSFLAWYMHRRVPSLPWLFIWCGLMFAPWTLYFSTTIVNPSYVLPFSILFFISVFELLPIYRQAIIPWQVCNFLCGLSFTAIMQLHLSYIILFPFLLLTCYFAWRRERALAVIALTIAGGLTGAATLLPTLLQHAYTSGRISSNIVFDPANLSQLPVLITRFLSFASYEVPYMIEGDTDAKLHFLRVYWWAAPATLLCLVAGFAQVGLYIAGYLWRKGADPIHRTVRKFTSMSILLLYFGFLFSVKGPSSHTFYAFWPVAAWYAFYQYDRLFKYHSRALLYMRYLFFAGLIYQVALMACNYTEGSLYKDRDIVVRALKEKDYRILGQRRPELWHTKGY